MRYLLADGDIAWAPRRPLHPVLKLLKRDPVLGARLSCLNEELAARRVADELGAPKASDRQADCLIEGIGIDFDGVRNALVINEGDPATLHPSKISYSPFLRLRP